MTEKHSAHGRFSLIHTIRIALDEDHRSIVKYLSQDDSFSNDVSREIERMVQRALGQAKSLDGSRAILKNWGPHQEDSAHITSPAIDYTARPAFFSEHASRQPNTEESIFPPPMSTSFLENDVGEPFTRRFRAFEKDIRGCDGVDQVDGEALDDTCEWIQHRTAFQDWKKIQKSSILILEGAAGIGKSVLAKSIIENLVKDGSTLIIAKNTVVEAQKEPDKAKQDVDVADQEAKAKDTGGSAKEGNEGRLVLSFFSSRSGRQNTLLFVLRHLMNQLIQVDRKALKASARKHLRESSTTSKLQSYWELFKDACLQSSHGIYCIIDGLDECLEHLHHQPTSEVDNEMAQFLRRVYAVADEHVESQGSNLFKILITTRPQTEVSLAAEGKNILYRISNVDVTPGVEKLVRKEVQELAIARGMSSKSSEEMIDKIIQRSGPLFLWARAFLELVRKPDYQLGTRAGMMEVLDRFNLKNYDDVYDEALQNILPTSRKTLGKLMRLLYYSRTDMDLEVLSHALAIEPDDPSPSNFSGRIHGFLQSFIEQSCGALLQVIPSNTTQTDTEFIVRFRHQSVPEFLARLTPEDSPDYSCSPNAFEVNNCYVAQLCLRYLILWRQQEVSREEIEHSDGERIVALTKKSPFLRYAACEWDFHVRMAGAYFKPHMPLVNEFLHLPTLSQLGEDYVYMLTSRTMVHSQEWSDTWVPYPPENFLAVHNLTGILESHLHPLPESPKYQKTIRGFLKKTMPFSKRGKRPKKVNRSNTIDISMTDNGGNTMLHDACSGGSHEAAQYLLICGADGSLQNNNGDTPFSLAIEEGHESLAKLLIERGESYNNTLDEQRVTMLHLACLHGMTSIAAYLLTHGANPNAKSFDDWTPVHIAVQSGHLATLTLLLGKGGDPSAAKSGGFTPLHLAAQCGHLDVAKMLLEFKRDLDPAPLSESRSTPLFLAASNGHVGLFDYLNEKQPTVQATAAGWLPVHAAASSGNLELIDRLKDRSNLYAETKTGRLAIHIAASNGHVGAVEKYLDLGIPVDIGCRDLNAPADSSAGKSITPLSLAIVSGSKALVTLLLQRRANISVLNYKNQSLLHRVAQAGHREIFDLLREQLDPHAEDLDQRTPLMLAAQGGHKQIIEFYLQAGDSKIAINKEDKFGWTALLLALRGEHKEISLTLIEAGANVAHVSHGDSFASAHYAAFVDDEQIFEKLLNGGASLTLQTSEGSSPLHYAAQFGKMISIRFLLRNNVDVNVQSEYGNTPLNLASKGFNTEAVKLLLAAGADPSLCDLYGLTPLDHAGNYQPIRDIFLEKFPLLELKTRQEQRSRFELTLKELLTKDVCCQNKEDRQKSFMLMASCFLKVDKLEEARICFEQLVRKRWDGKSLTTYFRCDTCFRDFSLGAAYFCAACPDSEICSKCYPKRAEGYQPRGCEMTHQYIKVGGAKWKALADGQVSEGETLEQWLHRQRQELGVGLSVEPNPNTRNTEAVQDAPVVPAQ